MTERFMVAYYIDGRLLQSIGVFGESAEAVAAGADRCPEAEVRVWLGQPATAPRQLCDVPADATPRIQAGGIR